MTAQAAQMSALQVLCQSFRRTLLAENKAPKTVKAYLEATTLLGNFLTQQGMPTAVQHIKREHVESFIADLLARWKPATAHNRYRALQAFFKWLVQEAEIRVSPMQNMKPPHLPEEPPAVLTEADLQRLLRACDGKNLESRRDTAIIRLLLDTGMRRTECAKLTVDDVDLDSKCRVRGG